MATSRRLFYENVRVGDEVPPVGRPPVDRALFARYAGATDDFNPLHVDEDYARRAGFPGTFAHGTMLLGWLGALGADFLRGGQLRRLSGRFIKIVWPGEELTCCGRVIEKRREGGEYWVDLDLWVENQKGELVAKGAASGTLFHSPEDEERQRRGLPPLIVEDEERPSLAEVFEREMGRVTATPPQKGAAAPRRPAPAVPKRPAAKAAPAPRPAAKAAGTKRPAAKAAGTKRPAAKAAGTKRPAAKLAPAKRSAAKGAGTKRPAAKAAGAKAAAARRPGGKAAASKHRTGSKKPGRR